MFGAFYCIDVPRSSRRLRIGVDQFLLPGRVANQQIMADTIAFGEFGWRLRPTAA
jgi:hypothetical protein